MSDKKSDYLTILCQLNNGCMGCCGNNFGSKEKIKESIKINTLEFDKINPKVKAQFLKFRNRAHPADLRFGVCRNLIEKNSSFFCPLHPALHNNDDLRRNHCDINYLCKTAKDFAKWDKNKQKKFINFINEKKMDHLDYSIKMENNSLLDQFNNLLSTSLSHTSSSSSNFSNK